MTGSTAAPAVRPSFVPPPLPKTPKSTDTRRLLLEAAGRLFVRRGYSAVSMREVAAEAALTKGALYGHFRSKGQLLVEVIRSKIAESDRSPEFSAAMADPERAIELMYAASGGEVRLLEVDAAAAARHDSDVAAGLAEFYLERHASIRASVTDAPDPDTAAWLIAAVSAGIGMKHSTGLALPDSDRLRVTLLAALRGVTESSKGTA